MTAAAGDRQAYCRKCARVARVLGDSLDPSRPLVVCEWRERDGSRHGHGRAVGTYHQPEAQALLAGAALLIHAQPSVARVAGLLLAAETRPDGMLLVAAGRVIDRPPALLGLECEANLAAGRRAYA